MTIVSLGHLLDRARSRAARGPSLRQTAPRPRRSARVSALLVSSALLLCASLGAFSLRASLLAGQRNADGCAWYTIEPGDTLTSIAQLYHTTIWTLVHANAIRNINLIFVSQRICVPSHGHASASGVSADGSIRWYDYNDLEWSNRSQVRNLLYQVAAIHRLPPRLLLAIAWQESGWTQHVIAWDGGIGVMQLMPYTAMSINASIGQQLDPYALWDNLNLGATYLQWLWSSFHGNLTKVISAYNEGGWAVEHQGIFNWSYVNNVLALMNSLS